VHGELSRSKSAMVSQLRGLLSGLEVEALRKRVAELLASGCFPEPSADRRPYPWPLV
jgi:hypothetical protein